VARKIPPFVSHQLRIRRFRVEVAERLAIQVHELIGYALIQWDCSLGDRVEASADLAESYQALGTGFLAGIFLFK